jgi:hypothetical protein
VFIHLSTVALLNNHWGSLGGKGGLFGFAWGYSRQRVMMPGGVGLRAASKVLSRSLV